MYNPPAQTDGLGMKNSEQRLRLLFGNAALQYDMAQLVKLLQPGKQYREKFLMKLGQKFFPICLDEISYFFAARKNVFVVLHDGQKIYLG